MLYVVNGLGSCKSRRPHGRSIDNIQQIIGSMRSGSLTTTATTAVAMSVTADVAAVGSERMR